MLCETHCQRERQGVAGLTSTPASRSAEDSQRQSHRQLLERTRAEFLKRIAVRHSTSLATIRQ
jgi:hypothetical protein